MQKNILWVVSGVVSLVMLMGGSGKLAGVPMMHESFDVLGLPSWFGYFIGTCEIAGAIGIWIPRLSSLAAAGVSCIMLGALYYHVNFTPIAQGTAAMVVLICALYVAVRRKDQAFWAR